MWWSWRKKVRELEEGHEKTRREVDSALLDVRDTLEKAQRILGRLNKRAQESLRVEGDRDTEGDAATPRPSGPTGAVPLHPLTGAPLDPVSQRIMRMRHRNGA